jgi:hypothetical protein
MDAKLRAFLKNRGIADAELDKIARGQIPDDTLRKTNDNPVLEKFRQCDDLLKEILSRLEKIEREDARRASALRGLEMFAKGRINGIAALRKEAAP